MAMSHGWLVLRFYGNCRANSRKISAGTIRKLPEANRVAKGTLVNCRWQVAEHSFVRGDLWRILEFVNVPFSSQQSGSTMLTEG